MLRYGLRDVNLFSYKQRDHSHHFSSSSRDHLTRRQLRCACAMICVTMYSSCLGRYPGQPTVR